MSSSVTIQISRNKNVAKDRSIAVLKLNKLTHSVGQPVMVKYYSEPDISNKIDTLFALGIKNGVGEDCYKIISLSGLDLIRDVVTSLPDISQLIHGELFIYLNEETNIWNYVFEEGGKRQVIPIENLAPTVFVNIEDKFRWFWDGSKLKREDDFYSNEKMSNLIDDFSLIIGPPKLNVYSLDGYLFPNGEIKDINVKVDVTNSIGEDITDRCDFYIDNEKVEINNKTIIIKGADKSKNYLIEAIVISGLGKKHTYTSTLKIEFGFNFFYGPVPIDWEINENNLLNLENKTIQSRKTIKYSPINLNYEKLVYSYPEFYGDLIHIFDEHGLDYLEDHTLYKLTLSSGLVYNVYIKNDAINIRDFEQSYQFVKTDEEEEVGPSNITINNEKYDEIVNAWENQNTPGGVVVVNESGKIPSYLVEGVTSDISFTQLVGFLDHYPLKTNMTVGDKWYNTVEKKIFTATSSSNGAISNPINNMIYFNNTDKQLYQWYNNDMVSVGTSIKTEKLDNVIDILD